MNAYQITLQCFLAAVEDAHLAWTAGDLDDALHLAETLPDDLQAASDAVWTWCDTHPGISEAVEHQVTAMKRDRLPGDGRQPPKLTVPAFRNALRNGILKRQPSTGPTQQSPTGASHQHETRGKN